MKKYDPIRVIWTERVNKHKYFVTLVWTHGQRKLCYASASIIHQYIEVNNPE